jgi:superfamily I DNA and RNA helicase
LAYLNPGSSSFNLLDEIISFDDRQQSIYALETPLIVIGSAGSGKTALTLEKIKQAPVMSCMSHSRLIWSKIHGICITLTTMTTLTSRSIFLSFQEFLESFRVPDGKLVTFAAFQQ